MNKFWFAITILFSVVTVSLTSCAESEEDEMGEYDISTSSDFALLADAVEQEEDEMDSEEEDCFVVTFPITVINPDNSTQEISTEGDLESYYEEWEDQYEDDGTIPTLMYPIEVTLADGTVQSLENDTALRELLTNCYGSYSDEDEDEDEDDDEDSDEDEDDDSDEDDSDEDDDAEELAVFLSCYDFVFPLQLTDGVDTIAANTIEEFIALYEQDSEIDYDLVFPLDLIDLSNSSTITVTTEDELDELEDVCEASQG